MEGYKTCVVITCSQKTQLITHQKEKRQLEMNRKLIGSFVCPFVPFHGWRSLWSFWESLPCVSFLFPLYLICFSIPFLQSLFFFFFLKLFLFKLTLLRIEHHQITFQPRKPNNQSISKLRTESTSWRIHLCPNLSQSSPFYRRPRTQFALPSLH